MSDQQSRRRATPEATLQDRPESSPISQEPKSESRTRPPRARWRCSRQAHPKPDSAATAEERDSAKAMAQAADCKVKVREPDAKAPRTVPIQRAQRYLTVSRRGRRGNWNQQRTRDSWRLGRRRHDDDQLAQLRCAWRRFTDRWTGTLFGQQPQRIGHHHRSHAAFRRSVQLLRRAERRSQLLDLYRDVTRHGSHAVCRCGIGGASVVRSPDRSRTDAQRLACGTPLNAHHHCVHSRSIGRFERYQSARTGRGRNYFQGTGGLAQLEVPPSISRERAGGSECDPGFWSRYALATSQLCHPERWVARPQSSEYDCTSFISPP